MADTTFNIEEKREELKALWESSFDLCKLYVAQASTGEAKLTGSLLRELNLFLKTSVSLLQGFADEERRQKEDRMREAQRAKVHPDDGDADGDDLDDGDPYQHLMDGLTLEDLDVPETYRD